MPHTELQSSPGPSSDPDDSITLSMLHSQLHESLTVSPMHKSPDEQHYLEDLNETRSVDLSRASAVILITTLSGITFVGSMSGGLLTVGLPTIAKDLDLANNLLLW